DEAPKRVSIHAPAWGATSTAGWRGRERSSFNPRARVGRDPFPWVKARWAASFQSTRPRGARRRDAGRAVRATRVSIHAPAWGATWHYFWGAYFDYVSIHAPAWGATGRVQSFVRKAIVSIHAPAWGATGYYQAFASRQSCFNPRARVGRDVSRDPSG